MAARQLPGRASGGALLISMPEIAELAGVRRPVVTAWRRRHLGFPAPAEGGIAAPLFDARAVVEWLVATGRADRARIEPELSLRTLTAFGAEFPAGDLVAMLTALICLRWLDEDEPLDSGSSDIVAAVGRRAASVDPADDLLLSEIRQLPPGSGFLASAADDLIEAAWGCQGAVERIMAARHRFGAAELATGAVPPELAWLVARLSGAGERSARPDPIMVADPAAGPGDLIAAVIELLGVDHLPRCGGAERSSYLARLARRRLVVHGIPPQEAEIAVAGDLPDGAASPDVIVTQIPYQPSSTAEAVLDRIGEVSARLRPDATAVVVGPADVLVSALPASSGAAPARAKLLQDHLVEAMVRLPGGLARDQPGYQLALWVLGPGTKSSRGDRILLADVSARELTYEVIDELTEDVLAWRRGGYDPRARTRTLSGQVQVSDLVAAPRPLAVSRSGAAREQQAGAARVARLTQLQADLARIGSCAEAGQRPVHGEVAARAADRPVRVTIGALIRAGRLTTARGTRLSPAHLADTGQFPVLGGPELFGARRGQRKIDRATLAGHYPRAKLTEPGDVVVTTVPQLAATVDHEGYSVAEFPARILRIPAAEQAQFTPQVLAALLSPAARASGLPGPVRQVRRLDQYDVVLLSPAEVQRLDALLARLDQQLTSAQQQIDALTEIRNITAAGLLDGTLAIADPDDGPVEPGPDDPAG
jgi:hypothetical protein